MNNLRLLFLQRYELDEILGTIKVIHDMYEGIIYEAVIFEKNLTETSIFVSLK